MRVCERVSDHVSPATRVARCVWVWLCGAPRDRRDDVNKAERKGASVGYNHKQLYLEMQQAFEVEWMGTGVGGRRILGGGGGQGREREKERGGWGKGRGERWQGRNPAFLIRCSSSPRLGLWSSDSLVALPPLQCVCVRARARACVRACVRAYAHVCLFMRAR